MQSTNGNTNTILIFITNDYNHQSVSYDVLSSILTVDLPIGDPVSTYLCANGKAPPCQTVSPACKKVSLTIRLPGLTHHTKELTVL